MFIARKVFHQSFLGNTGLVSTGTRGDLGGRYTETAGDPRQAPGNPDKIPYRRGISRHSRPGSVYRAGAFQASTCPCFPYFSILPHARSPPDKPNPSPTGRWPWSGDFAPPGREMAGYSASYRIDLFTARPPCGINERRLATCSASQLNERPVQPAERIFGYSSS
jgi:hypothetical protein